MIAIPDVKFFDLLSISSQTQHFAKIATSLEIQYTSSHHSTYYLYPELTV